MSVFSSVSAAVAPLVTSALDQAVTVLGPPATTSGAFGEAVDGARPEVATVAAAVYPESPTERIARDRAESVQGYDVRTEATAALAAVDGTYAFRWDRPAAEGGPLVLGVSGPGVATPSGLFLDFSCSYSR